MGTVILSMYYTYRAKYGDIPGRAKKVLRQKKTLTLCVLCIIVQLWLII